MSRLKNILTFGASGRIERKIEEFNDLKKEYDQLYREHNRQRRIVNRKLRKVVRVKIKAVKNLSKISKISKNIKGKEREFVYRNIGNEFETVDFQRIESTITAGQMAISATKGVSTGLGTAAGMWALASTFGTASTGTALTSLSGAAATKATLAWFGGGSLASGGGGAALGARVLGGFAIIPAIAVMGIFSHLRASKKIKEIEEEMLKILKVIDQMKSNILKMELIDKRSDELIPSIKKAQQAFKHELKRTLRGLNRLFIFSKLIRIIRSKMFRKNYYSNTDLKKIAHIGGIASNFATLIDTPVFDENWG